jgi:outer membrane murein-binding lipoprotein Lpp
MALTLDARVEVLEGKAADLEGRVENLEMGAGPGRADAHSANLADLRERFAGFGKVQEKQGQTLDIHTGKFNGLERSATNLQFDMEVLKRDVRQSKDEVSGRLERLDNDVSWLKGKANEHYGILVGLSTDVVDLRDDITGLTTKVDTLQSDVTGLTTKVDTLKSDVTGLTTKVDTLKSDVTGFRSELTGFKTQVTGTLAEILDRLPPKAA